MKHEEVMGLILSDIRRTRARYEVTDNEITVKLSYPLAHRLLQENRFSGMILYPPTMIFGCRAELEDGAGEHYRIMIEASYVRIPNEQQS